MILLLIYLIYRRRQDEQEQDQQQDQQVSDDEQHDSSTKSEYRQSAVRSLPTIIEENPNILPLNHKSIPLSSSSPLVFG